MKLLLRTLAAALVLWAFGISDATGQLNKQKPQQLDQVGVDEHLGDSIPLDTRMINSNGDTVQIGSLIEEGKPVILNPVYYECPMLCSLVLNGLFTGVKKLDWVPGNDFSIITFSIDPEEGVELARSNKQSYLDSLAVEGAADGWHFLTGTKEQIANLTDAVGFKFEYDEQADQYAHSAAIIFLSPKGKITRYLYGIDYSKLNLKNALYDAADGNIGNTVDKIVMYCYQYDPSSRSYVPVAVNIMKLGGLATMIILGVFLGFFWIREKRSTNEITEQ